MRRVIVTAAASALCGAGAWGKVSIGDEAPPLTGASWIAGSPVTAFAPGGIYVIELRPGDGGNGSRQLLEALQTRHRDDGVTVVRVTAHPPDPDAAPGETTLTLASDPGGALRAAYAGPNWRVAIVFVVGRDARVEWMGRVRDVPGVVAAVVDGRWDREAFPEVLELRRRLSEAMSRGRIDEGLEVLDLLIEKDYARSDRHWVRKFRTLLTTVRDPELAYATGRALVRDRWDDALLLNEVAWFVVDDPNVETRDLDFAMRAARRANELTGGASPPILDTVARVYYEQGDIATAIRWQEQAVLHARGTGWERPLRRTLHFYDDITPAY